MASNVLEGIDLLNQIVTEALTAKQTLPLEVWRFVFAEGSRRNMKLRALLTLSLVSLRVAERLMRDELLPSVEERFKAICQLVLDQLDKDLQDERNVA